MTQVLKAAVHLNLARSIYEDRSSTETVKDKVVRHFAGRREFAIAAFQATFENIFNIFKAAIQAIKGVFNKDARANALASLSTTKENAKIATTGFIGAVICPAAGVMVMKRFGLETAPETVPSVKITGLVAKKA